MEDFSSDDDDLNMADIEQEKDEEEKLIVSSVHEVVKVVGSARLQTVLAQIETAMSEAPQPIQGLLEDHPEYKLIVECNSLIVDIDLELNAIYKFIRDKYNKRFPELESLIPNQTEYTRVVRMVGNDTDNMPTMKKLNEILSETSVMMVTVTAATTAGSPLDDATLRAVLQGCEVADIEEDAKQKMLRFIESRMSLIAPNLSAVVGTSVAAKLMGAAGGLAALSRVPGCNIHVFGSKKRNTAGLSSHTTMPHAGYVYYTDLVAKTPNKYKMKAVKMLGDKCALAARIDCARTNMDGGAGMDMRADVERKLEKAQEPAPGHKIKALPAPIEKAVKKRGGRKARALKQRLGKTDTHKAMNRMVFGGQEVTDMQTGEGYGMLGQSGSGQVRVVTAKDTKIVGKAYRMLSKEAGGRSARPVSGLATSLAFTPVQGLELQNPMAAQQRAQAAEKSGYFSGKGFAFTKK